MIAIALRECAGDAHLKIGRHGRELCTNRRDLCQSRADYRQRNDDHSGQDQPVSAASKCRQ